MLLAVILSFCTLIAANPLTSLYHPPLPTCPASTSFSYVTSQTYTTTKTIIKSHLTTTTYTTTGVRERYCPTFITRVDEPAPWSTCAFDTKTCTRPMCLHLSTITQPCITDPCCTRTATDTVYAQCYTACPTGCATSWTVVSQTCTTPRARPTHN